VAIRAREFDGLIDPKAAAAREWREVLANVRTLS